MLNSGLEQILKKRAYNILLIAYPAIAAVTTLSGCSIFGAVTTIGSKPVRPAESMGHIVFAARDIKKGATITGDDFVEKEVRNAILPADAATAGEVKGKTAVEEISAGKVISVRDVGLQLTDAMIAASRPDNVKGDPSTKASVVVTASNIAKGKKITAQMLKSSQVPCDHVPSDALFMPSTALGLKCKFGLKAGQIVHMHDLTNK